MSAKKKLIKAVVYLSALMAASTGWSGDWDVVIAGEDEPGQRMEVSGVVYLEDGATPAAGVSLYVYHTDIKGLYHPDGGNDKHRLHATMVTEQNGVFRFRTIRPASYPDSQVPAHVHMDVTAEGYPNRSYTLQFADDPLLSARSKTRSAEAGDFGWIRTLEKGDDGVLRCKWLIRLRK